MLRRSTLIFLGLALTVAGQATTQAAQTSQTTNSGKTTATAKKPLAAKTSKNPVAVIHTTAGDLRCELFQDKTPKAVANFIGLAKGTKDWTDPKTGTVMHNKPLYNGVIFHRVIPEFMIQGGDPSGSGGGEIGFTLEDELLPNLLFDKPGRLAYANRGPNTSSSQFFITEKETPFLNPCLEEGGCPQLGRPKDTGYTLFGQCDTRSVALVKKIARQPCVNSPTCTSRNSRPQKPVKIIRIDILNGRATSPAGKKPAGKTTSPGPAPKSSSAPPK
jgi:peptidyl-prolyl cis-trans isomerase A (cyclophilin A)